MAVNPAEGASPPVFEQIFRNARFAQGGNALFEGKVKGNPRPQVVWTRKGLQMKGSTFGTRTSKLSDQTIDGFKGISLSLKIYPYGSEQFFSDISASFAVVF